MAHSRSVPLPTNSGSYDCRRSPSAAKAERAGVAWDPTPYDGPSVRCRQTFGDRGLVGINEPRQPPQSARRLPWTSAGSCLPESAMLPHQPRRTLAWTFARPNLSLRAIFGDPIRCPARRSGRRKTSHKQGGFVRGHRPRPPHVVSANMSAIRAIGGRTEVALRSALHRRGLRFRKNVTGLPGRPDIVFSSARLVVFVDGDFWHGRVLKEGGLEALERRIRAESKGYWIEKFRRRVDLDNQLTDTLTAMGWCVMRFWESDVRERLSETADTIERLVRERTQS